MPVNAALAVFRILIGVINKILTTLELRVAEFAYTYDTCKNLSRVSPVCRAFPEVLESAPREGN